MKIIQEICVTILDRSSLMFYIVNIPMEHLTNIISAMITIKIIGTNRSIRKLVKYCVISFLLYGLERIFIPGPLYKIIFTITSIILLNRIFKMNLSYIIAIQIIFSVIMVILESMATNVFFVAVIFIGFYLITAGLNISIEMFKRMTKNEKIKNTTFLALWISFIGIGLSKEIHLNKFIVMGEDVCVCSCCSILFSYYILANYIIKNERIRDVNLQIENLKNYNENLITQNESFRCFKHDFNNIIQAMSGYILLKDMSSLEKYFKKLKGECNNVKNMERLNPDVIKSPAIYGVLLNKYKVAEQLNIEMNIEAIIPPEFDSKKEYEVSRMLGILLDNAIEATKECEDKIVNIKFRKDTNNKDLIIIENTYNNPELDMDKIFDKEYSTKKGNSGLGLWKVKKIVGKSAYLDLYTTKNDEMFKQQLEIYK